MRDICQHIMDLVENAAASGAGRVAVSLTEDSVADRLHLVVEDDGCGMDAETVKRAADPFYTTRKTRPVGLGLSLLEAATRLCDGSFAVESAPGRGTRVECSFGLSHIDRAPLGDVAVTLSALVALHPEIGLRYEHRVGESRFCFDSADFRAALGEDIAATSPPALAALGRHIAAEWGAFLASLESAADAVDGPREPIEENRDERVGRL